MKYGVRCWQGDGFCRRGVLRSIWNRYIENPKAVEDFKGGKVKAKQALFGVCMKELKGTANTDVIRESLDKKMEGL